MTRDGHPILVELDDVDKLFREPPDTPSIRHLWVLENVGSAREPRGARAQHLADLDGDSRIEGLALDGRGRFHYVLDDDRIHLQG